MNEKPYELIETETADDFMEALNPVNLPKHCRGNMIYRGQSNADWPLTPSLFRYDKFGIDSGWSSNKIVRYEALILHSFVQNMGGINLSDHRILHLRDALEQISGEVEEYNKIQHITNLQNMRNPSKLTRSYGIPLSHEGWPSEGVLELMALAQHSGLPTRLLDWTYSPYVAAYFAAFSSIGPDISDKEKIAVWSIDKNYTYNARQKNPKLGDISTNIYRLEPPFWGSNPNAVAQSGCFLFIKEPSSDAEFKKIHLDQYLPNVTIANNTTQKSKTAFRKITVPAKEIGNIIKICDLFGISYSKLFRSYEGCAAEAKIYLPNIKKEINHHSPST